MNGNDVNRRIFSMSVGAIAGGSALAGVARAAPDNPQAAPSAGDDGVSRSNEAIHQEVSFNASATRIYQALTDPAQFSRVVELSGVMESMRGLTDAPTQISPEVGGAFLLFGGYISGRHLELTPNVRIIQAWKSASWKPHIYSIARFELLGDGHGVKLVFDHTGFPNGEGASLARGWREHYWTPLARLLAQR